MRVLPLTVFSVLISIFSVVSLKEQSNFCVSVHPADLQSPAAVMAGFEKFCIQVFPTSGSSVDPLLIPLRLLSSRCVLVRNSEYRGNAGALDWL